MAVLPLATEADLDLALLAAERGFALWRDTPPEKRAAILNAAAALMVERSDRIARIATLEQGKIFAEAKGEAMAAAALLSFHAGETQRIYGRVLPRPPGTRSLVLHQPVGPVAAFCAWNFPILNVVRKIAPALAAGCSIILKPSEETPDSATEVMRCFNDAGLPAGVAQLVFGIPNQVSRRLLASPITRKLSFTGSVAVGKHLARLATDSMMRVTLELGGHAPVLVFADCDLDKTLDTLVAHKFRNAGQVCIAPTRILVEAPIYDRFVDGFAARMQSLRVGSGLDANSGMGPLANKRRSQALHAMVADTETRGGRIVSGSAPEGTGGFFFRPTLVADAPLSSTAMNEEPFGPVALIRPFETIDDAIVEANRLPFGLAAYCFTRDGRRQAMLGDRIEAGMIAINGVRLTWGDSPFGGIKDSGYGSEDGPEGVAAHLITKAVHLQDG